MIRKTDYNGLLLGFYADTLSLGLTGAVARRQAATLAHRAGWFPAYGAAYARLEELLTLIKAGTTDETGQFKAIVL